MKYAVSKWEAEQVLKDIAGNKGAKKTEVGKGRKSEVRDRRSEVAPVEFPWGYPR